MFDKSINKYCLSKALVPNIKHFIILWAHESVFSRYALVNGRVIFFSLCASQVNVLTFNLLSLDNDKAGKSYCYSEEPFLQWPEMKLSFLERT